MELDTLSAISPIDGRYRSKVADLAPYFSESALIRYRLRIEVEYFIALAELPLPNLKDATLNNEALRKLYLQFTSQDAQKVKDIERETNHDVKALEYFLKDALSTQNLEDYREFVHFGLTSQDVNNTAVPLSFKEAINQVYLPRLGAVILQIENLSKGWVDIPMLARTHGQPASPTRLGKELQVFVERLQKQAQTLGQIPFAAKFGGATGNFNAHFVAYPEIAWHQFANEFLEKLGLVRSQTTTQIEHYDFLAAMLDNLKRINVILIDLARDVWQYIAMNYFRQKTKANEVGSSAMPHKVNPIDFENAEGNLGIANALFEHLSHKLPISRLQRDLTDSTVLRNLGMPIAHSFLALQSLAKGLDKLELNEVTIQKDLANNWAVVAEAIQTILRREQYPAPYEALKALTRGKQHIGETEIKEFIETLEVSESVKAELRQITPFNYVGK